MLTPAEWETVLLSLKISAVAVGATFPFGLLVAYLLVRRRGLFAFALESIILLPLVLPPIVTGVFLLDLLGPEGSMGWHIERLFGSGVAFTWIRAALAAAVVAFPLMVQAMRIAFAQVEREWEEAGLVYGGTRWDVWRLVILPLTGRGIAAAVVLAFARALGEFGATIVVAGNIPGRTRTIPLAIFTRLHQVGGEEAVFRLVVVAVVLSIASLAAYFALTRTLYDPQR